jgi:RNA polymerase sigma-B factor
MLVHLVSRRLTPTDHIPDAAITLLARSLRSAGATVIEDVSAPDSSDVDGSVRDCARELQARWREHRPDIVHTIGLVAALAAVQAGAEGPPVVATFDESPSRGEIERAVADQVVAVMPLSLEEHDRWRRAGVRSLWTGPFPFVVPHSHPDDSSGDAAGDVVTSTTGQDLDATVASMPHWKGRLVIAVRVAPARLAALRTRAQALGVWDRIRLRPAPRGRERDEMWSRAAVVVAGRRGSRHGGQVLEAAAHGIPSIAVKAGAHVDHVVPETTGVLVPPNANPRSLGRAVASVVSNGFGLRAMGSSALVRVRTLHSSAPAARRLMSMYGQVLADESTVRGAAMAEPSGSTVLGSGDERDTLVGEHMGLARQLAGWYSGRGQSAEDLLQVASVGLVLAAQRFDPAHGKPFHSFAIPTILGELRKHFRDHAWAVRVPRRLQETTLDVRRASSDATQSLGHEATPADLAEQLGLTEKEVLLALRAQREARSWNSLDHPTGEAGSFADLVGQVDPELELAELRHGLRDALQRMPEREQQILIRRFHGEQTQSEIAEQLGISQVQVSRILTRTLATLRDHLLEDVPLPKSWER